MKQEVKIENTHNINAMEEIIKLTEERVGLPTSTPTSTTSSAGATALPINFLQTDSAIQVFRICQTAEMQLSYLILKSQDCYKVEYQSTLKPKMLV